MLACPSPSLSSRSASLHFFSQDRYDPNGEQNLRREPPWDTKEDSLRLAFSQDGRNVKDVTIMSDRETGRPRGFGFVEMGSNEDAQAAISALDGSELGGRNIRVDEAQERQPRGGGGRW